MAAGEDEAQPVVVDAAVPSLDPPVEFVEFMLLGRVVGDPLTVGAGPVAADRVECLARCDGEDPARGVRRPSVDRPFLGRDEPRVLQRLLGELEVAVLADQRREDAARVRSDRILETAPFGVGRRQPSAPGITMSGRTSVRPYLADGSSAPSSSARSRESTSTM